MTTDIIGQFMLASTHQRVQMILDVKNHEALLQYFGPKAFGQYERLAGRLDSGHLGLQAPKNLVVVPGLMGSLLKSETKGGIWWIDARTRRHIDDLRLSPDGLEDADPRNCVQPCTIDTSYEPFLTAILEREDFGHEIFAYDWRKSLTESAKPLRDLILELYAKSGEEPVHLVGHSMGGLMIRVALMEYGEELWPKVGKIVFIGTPHYGSPAISAYLKNHLSGFDLMALLGRYLSRETFRSMWGVLSLLPAPVGIYPGTVAGDAESHPCANFQLYTASAWRLDLSDEEERNLQRVLDGAALQHYQLKNWHQGLDVRYRDKMLVIAGVGYRTLFRLAYSSAFPGIWATMKKTTSRLEGDINREGDGRVSLASVSLEGVAVRYVKGVHGELMNIPEVVEGTLRWLKGRETGLAETVEGALRGHLGEGGGLDLTEPFSDDPGFWKNEIPQEARMKELEELLNQGVLWEFNYVKLL